MTKTYESRTYRNLITSSRLQTFTVVVQETDLCVHARTNLKDITKELVLQYRGYLEAYIRKNPDLIHIYLSQHAKNSSEKYYYQVRNQYNRSKPSAAQAARFIYLNKTCFNGIFRVNMEGEFNVPYGWKHPPFLPSLNHLRQISKILKGVKILSYDYQKTLENTTPKDFISKTNRHHLLCARLSSMTREKRDPT